MTPAARVQAAIEILDQIGAGKPAEQALTNWGRASRFAGSGDRAAVRDHVFDVLRRWRSTAAMGADSGRGRMIGLLRQQDADLARLFTGEGHAPAPLSADETGAFADMPLAVSLDCPDWLWPLVQSSLGDQAAAAMSVQRDRAAVFLRVNPAKGTRDTALKSLEKEGIAAGIHGGVETALTVHSGARKLAQSAAYQSGLVELQDASSQAACLALAPAAGESLLDYCAGGGGKSLALAALGAQVSAHDIDPRRTQDIGPRAARAGVRMRILATAELGPLDGFDTVFCDAPCSGSGTWRRAPEAKWALSPDRLGALGQMQDQVLDQAAQHVAPGGRLGYATCSILRAENQDRVAAFLGRNAGFTFHWDRHWMPGSEGDGFYLAVMMRQQ